MTKNIIVTDANGDIIGTTYPKRAKGLVKNGRACFAGSDTIRMSASVDPSDTNISEDKSMIYITFKGDEWLRRDVDISFMSNVIDGSVTEALMLGSWNNGQKVAQSRIFMLTPNTEYRFVFWLNGGENESGDETCEFKVAFFSDWENANVYKLNRGYIRPLLHQKGWELYELPFKTPDVEGDVSVTFAFVANKAPMAVLPALEPSAYADLKDEPDEFEDYRPQRHNIVFKDGWPSITQYGGDKYSTEAIKRRAAKDSFKEQFKKDFHFENPFDKEKFEEQFKKDFHFDKEALDEQLKKSIPFGGKSFHFGFSTGDEDEEELWEEVDELADDIGATMDETEDMISDAEDHLEDAEDELEDITDDEDFDAASHQAEIDALKAEIDECENQVGYLNSDLGFLGKKLGEITKRMKRHSDPEHHKAALQELLEKAKALYEKAEAFSDTTDDLYSRVTDLR